MDCWTFSWQTDTCVKVFPYPRLFPEVALVHGADQPDVIRRTWRLLQCLRLR